MDLEHHGKREKLNADSIEYTAVKITNAYLVLSVADIKDLLRAAELEQKRRNNLDDSVCLILEDLTVKMDADDEPQIASWSIVRTAENYELDYADVWGGDTTH